MPMRWDGRSEGYGWSPYGGTKMTKMKNGWGGGRSAEMFLRPRRGLRGPLPRELWAPKRDGHDAKYVHEKNTTDHDYY